MMKRYNPFDNWNDFVMQTHIEWVLAKRRLDHNPEYNIEPNDFLTLHWDNLISCFKQRRKYEYEKTNRA
jgi:hypothetical protein